MAGPAESNIIGVTCCVCGSDEVSATAVVVLEGGMFEEPSESDVIGVTCSICCTDEVVICWLFSINWPSCLTASLMLASNFSPNSSIFL